MIEAVGMGIYSRFGPESLPELDRPTLEEAATCGYRMVSTCLRKCEWGHSDINCNIFCPSTGAVKPTYSQREFVYMESLKRQRSLII